MQTTASRLREQDPELYFELLDEGNGRDYDLELDRFENEGGCVQ